MSAIFWFEIPVTDIDRARAFYGALLKAEIPFIDMTEQMGSKLGSLPNRVGVGGMLVENAQHGYVPSDVGTMVYLALGDEDMNDALARVEAAGGTILLPKAEMPGRGFAAWIRDLEGNKVGLHSDK